MLGLFLYLFLVLFRSGHHRKILTYSFFGFLIVKYTDFLMVFTRFIERKVCGPAGLLLDPGGLLRGKANKLSLNFL